MSALTQVRAEISKYIEVLAETAGFDIYVVDDQLLRVCGTGIYSKMLGIVLPPNTSNGWVIKNREPLFMFNPCQNEICAECPMNTSNNCAKEYSIHAPILSKDACLGSVTIASAYEDGSKRRMEAEKETLYRLVMLISREITALWENKIKSGILDTLLNYSDESVIITDQQGHILQTTERVKKNVEGLRNIYELIPKNKESFGGDFEKTSFQLNERLQVQRVKAPLGHSGYSQLFFLKTEKPSEAEEAFFIDKELFLSQIIGKNEAIEELKTVVLHVAQYDSNCLILGESGTGKEMFARLIHNLSDRREHPFVPINCAAIPEHLMESEMFGYEPGAFTDAHKKGKRGLFEEADQGTLFLDEIGDMPIYLQPKLLRVIETGKITRVGSTKEIQLNVRFVAATNKNLAEKIRQGQFRDDLYYRLCVIPLTVPALRERTEDILELTRYFIDKYNQRFSKRITKTSEVVKKKLLLYDWPGNVRELENVIEYAVTMEKTDTLTAGSLPLNIGCVPGMDSEGGQKITLGDFKRQNMLELLRKHGDSVEAKAAAAAEMGISLSTLYRYIKKYEG